MSKLDMKALATQDPATKTRFFGRLWRAVLRFDEALNFDPHDDLARRVADTERQLEASRMPNRTSSQRP